MPCSPREGLTPTSCSSPSTSRASSTRTECIRPPKLYSTATLRAGFVTLPGGDPAAVVLDSVALPWHTVDLSDSSDTQAALTQLLDADRRTPFDPSVAPLLRLTLVRLATERYELVIDSPSRTLRRLVAPPAHAGPDASLRLQWRSSRPGTSTALPRLPDVAEPPRPGGLGPDVGPRPRRPGGTNAARRSSSNSADGGARGGGRSGRGPVDATA